MRIFFETEAKDLPHRLIKQKRIAQLINGKPGENQKCNSNFTEKDKASRESEYLKILKI